MNKNIVIFTGQTATGKTELAVEYAKANNGEIICMDSMQIYESMPILSAAPLDKEKQGIQHHLFEFVLPLENFSVARYEKLAKEKINDIILRGKLPILVGGTGLYMNSLLYVDLSAVPYNATIREELELKTNQELFEILQKIGGLSKVHINDRKRLIRAIEIYRITGKTKTEIDKRNRQPSEYNAKIYARKIERSELYDRINLRTKEILDNGAIEEVKNLLELGVKSSNTASGAIGFKEIKAYQLGETDYDECLEKFRQSTRNYAKRQETWFKANREIIYI